MKPTKESKGRLRHLEDEGEDALLAVAPEPLRTIILFGIYVGLRLGSKGADAAVGGRRFCGMV